MKAFVLKQTGGAANLIAADVPVPLIDDHEVLIKVAAISINPIDVTVRKNDTALKLIMQLDGSYPQFLILGWDMAGTVVAVGKNVVQFQPGDKVVGMINFPGQGKAYAEYIAAPEDQLALKPENISFEEAAAATLAAMTAYQSLVTYGKVSPGDKVLIHAAAGGVGHYAVQIAKHLGAFVIGTASDRNRDLVLSLGADEFIDYKNRDFEKLVTDADLVLDSIATDDTHIYRSLNTLKNGGRLISLRTFFDEGFIQKLAAKHVYGHRLKVISNGDDMKQIAEWLGDGTLKSYISGIFDFNDLPKAHQVVETGSTPGKVIVKIF